MGDMMWYFFRILVSVRNPPPICYAVPKVSLANLCVQFYQLDVKDKLLSGCVRVVAEVAHTEIYRQTIGCFRFPVFPRVAKRITAHALYIVTRSTVLAEINAHPEISVHQKQWFSKGGVHKTDGFWWVLFQRGEYTKPMGFDGWFFKGGSTQNRWVLMGFGIFLIASRN